MSNKKKAPVKCSLYDCQNVLDANDLIFTHKKKAAGGICTQCLGGSKGIRVFFALDSEGIYEPEELVSLTKGF